MKITSATRVLSPRSGPTRRTCQRPTKTTTSASCGNHTCIRITACVTRKNTAPQHHLRAASSKLLQFISKLLSSCPANHATYITVQFKVHVRMCKILIDTAIFIFIWLHLGQRTVKGTDRDMSLLFWPGLCGRRMGGLGTETYQGMTFGPLDLWTVSSSVAFVFWGRKLLSPRLSLLGRSLPRDQQVTRRHKPSSCFGPVESHFMWLSFSKEQTHVLLWTTWSWRQLPCSATKQPGLTQSWKGNPPRISYTCEWPCFYSASGPKRWDTSLTPWPSLEKKKFIDNFFKWSQFWNDIRHEN